MNLHATDLVYDGSGFSFTDENQCAWRGTCINTVPATHNGVSFRGKLSEGPSDLVGATVDVTIGFSEGKASIRPV